MLINDLVVNDRSYQWLSKTVGINDRQGVFAVCAAGITQGDRCDSTRLGPVSLHRWDEQSAVCSCGSTDRPHDITLDHYVTIDMVEQHYPVIEAVPYGFIVYVELRTTDQEDEMARMPLHTRTIQELLRYMIEWEWMASIGITDPIAVLCRNMMSVMNPPDDVRQWVLDNVPYSQLGRFLRGDVDARERPSGVPDLVDYVDEWIASQVIKCRRYGDYVGPLG